MGAGPGSAEVGPAPVWRATPRARAETLRAAPETVSGTGQQHAGAGGEWGVGPAGGARAGGQQQGPTPWGSRRPTINPSLRKIAPRRAAQPLNIRTRAGVWGLAPTRSSAAGENWPKMAKMTLNFFVFLAFLAGVSSAPRLQKRPARPEPRGSAFYIGGAKRAIGGLGAEGSGPSVTGVGGPLNPSG